MDIKAWVRQTASRQKGGTRCQTCKNAKAKEAIRSILQAALELDEGSISMPEIHGYLVDNCDYHFSLAGLRNHVYRCERELWEQMQAK